jgi:hypothetical protein
MRLFYEDVRLGTKQSVTPEGFLICHDVPVARTGAMRYLAAEVDDPEHPIAGDAEGIVVAERTPEEVFRTETIASFEGKPITIDHPDELVGPDNWGAVARGHMQNVRRGEGAQDDLLLADLLITHRDGIDAVRKGLREVSCGYEATYDQVTPGRAIQRGILGNHLALVARGRCGPRCAIGDSHKEATTMTIPVTKTNDGKAAKKTMSDRLKGLAAFFDADESDEDEDKKDKKDKDDKKETTDAIAKAVTAAVKDAMDPVMKAIKSLDEDMEELKKSKTDDDGEDLTDPKTAESNPDATGEGWTGDSLDATLQRAEILAPGGPRFTADGKAKKVGDAVCSCQRAALKRASTADATKDAIAPLLAGIDLDKATYDTLRPLFVAATEIVKTRNAPRVQGMTNDSASMGTSGKPVTVADAQKLNNDFWAARRA